MALIGTAAAAAYLNAKYHISKDVDILWKLYRSEREYATAAANGKGNVWFLFYEAALQNPDKVIIWTREAQYTYRETLAKTIQYAHYFHSLGVQKGQLVAFYLHNRPEFLFAWLALWSLGCAPATVNYNLAGDALQHCLRLSGAKVVLVDDDPDCVQRIEDSRAVLEGELGFHITQVDQMPLQDFPTSTLPNDGKDAYDMDGEFACMLLYTSGTTGMPKATPFTMHRLYPRACDRRRAAAPDECWYSCMPLYHGTAGIVQIANVSVGVTVALGKKFSARSFWPDVRDSQATTFVYVGEAVRYLLAAPPSPLDREHKLRHMQGNGLRPDVWERFRERFGVQRVVEFFGSSEGMLMLLNDNQGPFTSGSVGHHGLLLRFLLRNTFVPVAIDHNTGDIMREANGYAVRQPYSTGGEILVHIPNEEAFQGYWRNKDATKKKFVRNVFCEGDLYYRSGDALRRTDDGRWYFLDRLGDTFRWKSENVSTAEVAETIGAFPGIAEANVYGVQIPHHEGRAGCAAIQISPPAAGALDYQQLAQFASQKLPKYAVPVFVRLLSGASHIHNLKQNKAPLRDEGIDLQRVRDQMLWLRGGTYIPFVQEDWEAIQRGDITL